MVKVLRSLVRGPLEPHITGFAEHLLRQGYTLGLRAGEVARLGLDDIDWRRGEITIVGKANRGERLPLPADVARRSRRICAAAGRPPPRAAACSCG